MVSLRHCLGKSKSRVWLVAKDSRSWFWVCLLYTMFRHHVSLAVANKWLARTRRGPQNCLSLASPQTRPTQKPKRSANASKWSGLWLLPPFPILHFFGRVLFLHFPPRPPPPFSQLPSVCAFWRLSSPSPLSFLMFAWRDSKDADIGCKAGPFILLNILIHHNKMAQQYSLFSRALNGVTLLSL